MKNLLKESYKVENMIVKNSTFRTVYHDWEYNCKKESVSELEKKFTDEEKLAIIDSWTDGLGTYLLDLIDKYLLVRNNEEVIKHTKWGGYNQTSLKAWLKKNDPRKIIYVSYNGGIPTYNLFSTKFRMSKETPRTDYSYKMLYDAEPVVRQWFHGLLKELFQKETEYFNNTDETQVKINIIKELGNKISLHFVNNQRMWDIVYNNHREGYSIEELDQYIEVLNRVIEFDKEQSKLIDEIGAKYE